MQKIASSQKMSAPPQSAIYNSSSDFKKRDLKRLQKAQQLSGSNFEDDDMAQSINEGKTSKMSISSKNQKMQ